MPRGEPAELALGHEIAGFSHARMTKIGCIGEHRREDSAGFIGNPTALQMRKALAESGPSIDFSKEELAVLKPLRVILDNWQADRLRFSLDLCQSTGEPGTPFG